MRPIDDPRIARAALSFLAEPGTRWLVDQITRHGPVTVAHVCLADTTGACPLRGEVQALSPGQRWEHIQRILDDADRHRVRVVIPGDPEWPAPIDQITALPQAADLGRWAAPVCLWVRGTRPVADTLASAIAVTGARASTSYGSHTAQEISHDLATAGRTIVATSGFGIDTAACQGTLAAGGVPVALIARGPERAYPVANTGLLAAIAHNGLLISAWPPGQPPSRTRFTATRLLLAACTQATVLVEAGLRSSSLLTLRAALAVGHPGFVVPGPVTSALSAGAHDALRRYPGCRLVTSAGDILADLADLAAEG